MTAMPEPKRIAICGTAPTWAEIPWDDPTLEIWALNDMHVLNLPRADRWFDLHPLDEMFFAKPGQKPQDKPPGTFYRPANHLAWLKAQTIPVYVQDAAKLGSPSARTFPKAEIEAAFGPYFASSPAWMIGLALLEGVTELHIYGIHLATEWEYLKQKPNMTFLLGLAAGRGVKLVLPKGCPLLKESHQYAYEPDPDLPKLRLERQMKKLMAQREALPKATDKNTTSRRAWLDAQITDMKLGIAHAVAGQLPAGW